MRFFFQWLLLGTLLVTLAACSNALDNEAEANLESAVQAMIDKASEGDSVVSIQEGSWICAETTARGQTMVSCMFFFTYETLSGATHYASVSAGGSEDNKTASATLYDNTASFTAARETALDNMRSFGEDVSEGELSQEAIDAVMD